MMFNGFDNFVDKFLILKWWRWSKIAQYLPGRTDNEIKNYWRTRVQKQAKQLKCDVNSKQFQDAMRFVWIPRLVERIHAGQPTAPAPRVDPSPTPDPDVSPASSSSELPPPPASSDPLPAQNESGAWEYGSDVDQSGCGGGGGGGEYSMDDLWINDEDIWFLQQQLCDCDGV